MTYLKVGDGVFVNGGINPYNLGTIDPMYPQVETLRYIAASAGGRPVVTAGRTELSWCYGYHAERVWDEHDPKLLARIDPVQECADELVRIARNPPATFDALVWKALRQRDADEFDGGLTYDETFKPPESAADLVNRVAAEQRDDESWRMTFEASQRLPVVDHSWGPPKEGKA